MPESLILLDTAAGVRSEPVQQKSVANETSLSWTTLRGGVREGVDLLEVDNGALRFAVVPTRGMGLWQAWLGETPIGWRSPVRGPVNPVYVPVTDPTGLGWLEGFDELMCRCGLVSNGAPDFGADGICHYPLHGRVANIPAHRVEVAADESTGEVQVTGVVDETRFLFQKLRLTAGYKTSPGRRGLTIFDRVTNLSGEPAEMQLLYHVNFGPPILDAGAKLVAPVAAVVPRDARAAEGINTWSDYPAEQAGFTEQVYFFQLASDDAGDTHVLLKNAHASQGVSLRYNVRQLPYFTQWKNTPLAADGYVTGLEPGTNFPNPRTFEGEMGRVVRLEPGASVEYRLELDVHADAASVAEAERAVAQLQGDVKPEVFATPQPKWTRT